MNRQFILSAISITIALLLCTPVAYTQSFGNLFREAAHKATQQVVRKTVEKATEKASENDNTAKQSKRDKQLEQRVDAMVHPGASKDVIDRKSVV